ncbi:MAG: very short patch repair endonuclease [Desulfovibrio sp.]
MDTIPQGLRSEIMGRVQHKDTRPEMVVRRLVHSLGYRYRLHQKDLPGKPDITFPGRRKIIFVHGCFWHRHEGCALARMPKSRVDFWNKKLEGNKARDQRNVQRLRDAGWDVLIVWECQLRDTATLQATIVTFLEGEKDTP